MYNNILPYPSPLCIKKIFFDLLYYTIEDKAYHKKGNNLVI